MIVVAAAAATLVAIAINAATDVKGRWPGGLELIRTHPFPSVAASTGLFAASGAVLWYAQRVAHTEADPMGYAAPERS